MNPTLDTPKGKSGRIYRNINTNTEEQNQEIANKDPEGFDRSADAYGWSIDTTQPVPSTALASNISRNDIQNRRNEMERARSQRIAAEQEQNRLQQETIKAGQMTDEEAVLNKELAGYNTEAVTTQEKTRQKLEELNKNAQGLFGGGLEQELNVVNREADKKLNDIALRRLAASNTLSALTGVRASKLDALKTSLGFEDKRLERLLGIEKDLKGMDKEEKEAALNGVAKIIEYSEGMDFEELDPASQQQVIEYAANSALPLSSIKQALKRNKIAFTEERNKAALEQQYLGSQINENNAQAAKALAESRYANDPAVIDDPLVNAIVNVNAGSAEGQQKRDATRIAQMVKEGRIPEARQLILSRVTSKMSAGERDAELDRRNTIEALTDIKQALADYAEAGGDTNLITGKLQDINQSLGQAGDPDLAAIKTRITQATQKYRNAITGAAWGKQEEKEYKAIFPSLGNTDELNMAIIDAMIPTLQSMERNAIGLFLGGNDIYDEVFLDGETQPQSQGNVITAPDGQEIEIID